MAIKKVVRVCCVQIKELLYSPMTYVFMLLLFVYFYHLNENAVKLQELSGLKLNIWGYTAAAFSSKGAVLVYALGAVAVFSDLPLIRPNALFESIRCSENVWIFGRILYIFCVSILYTLIMTVLCMLTCKGDFTPDPSWGKLLNTAARGRTMHELALPVILNVSSTSLYTPVQAFFLTFAFASGASFFLGLLLLAVSLFLHRIPALLAVSSVSVLDFMIEEKLPYIFYRYSPFSFMRLNIIANENMAYFPTASEAAGILTAMILIMIFILIFISHQPYRISGKILNEQF